MLEGGGHIAEIFDKQTGVNPLWTPHWPSIEPDTFDRGTHGVYGAGAEARLLAGIMGHNICLDIFGGPSPEEEAAGVTVHGEAPVVPYAIESAPDRLVARATLPIAQLSFEREVVLRGSAIRIRETVENLSRQDRPIGWTQHVTLAPPFLQKGATVFRASATRSQVYDGSFGADDYLKPGALFEWPNAPAANGAVVDLQPFTNAPVSSAYTAHLLDPKRRDAFFIAFTPALRLAFGYVWRQPDFPWMGIWEENLSRRGTPWNGATITRGMEFGVSPFPETRRQMIDRGKTFGVPGYRWIPAKSRVSVEYWAVVQHAASVPDTLNWPQE